MMAANITRQPMSGYFLVIDLKLLAIGGPA